MFNHEGHEGHEKKGKLLKAFEDVSRVQGKKKEVEKIRS